MKFDLHRQFFGFWGTTGILGLAMSFSSLAVAQNAPAKSQIFADEVTLQASAAERDLERAVASPDSVKVESSPPVHSANVSFSPMAEGEEEDAGSASLSPSELTVENVVEGKSADSGLAEKSLDASEKSLDASEKISEAVSLKSDSSLNSNEPATSGARSESESKSEYVEPVVGASEETSSASAAPAIVEGKDGDGNGGTSTALRQTEEDEWMAAYRAKRMAEAAEQQIWDPWAGLIRLELGLGWGASVVSSEALLGADTIVEAYGTAVFLGMKFRLSPRIPLQLGVDFSYSYHFILNDAGVKSIADYDSVSALTGNVTLTAFPVGGFYLMLGLGAGGLDRQVDVKVFAPRWEAGWKPGATGLVAAGILFDVATPFRIGLEARASGGIFDKDIHGMFSGHLVLSFF